VEATSKTSKGVDERFERAIHVLFAFKDNFPSNDPASNRKWEETVDALKEILYPKVDLVSVTVPLSADYSWRAANQRPERMRVVEFLLLRALPDKRPIIVKREPCSSMSLWHLVSDSSARGS
jgi:hypothetical protein